MISSTKINTIRKYLKSNKTLSLLIVDGGFSAWDEWGPCTLECGGGDQTRSRRCDSPPPQFGGADCVGELFECQRCNMEPCSSHCPV